MRSTFLILVLPCFFWNSCYGQSNPNTQDPTPTQPPNSAPQTSDPTQGDAPVERPKRDVFYSLAQRANQIKLEMDQLIGSMPVGFPKLQEQQTAKLEALKKERAELNPKIMAAALDAFREAPTEDQNVSMTVLGLLNTSLNPKTRDQNFDPELALEIATTFLNNNVKSIPLYYAAFRAAYAIQDFETARKMLEGGRSLSTPDTKLDEKVYERLNTTEQIWAQELETRRLEAAADDLPRVKFETTIGDFEVELFENQAPDTVGNFINLVEKGFYDGLIFYFVRPGAISQSGCPKGDGTGDPGYKIPCECYGENARHHFAGSLSMSNNGRDTGGSQFFFSHQTNPGLDGKYTVFGRLLGSMEPMYNMKMIDKTTFDPTQLEPTVIKKVTVIRKRDHEYVPKIVAATEGAPESTPTGAGEDKF